jgi:hypothetical protein
MSEDFSSLDVLDDDVEGFRRIGKPCILVGCSLGGRIVIVPEKVPPNQFQNAVCYLPEEARYLLSLNDHDAQMFHELKFNMGGFIDVAEGKIVNRPPGAPVR